MYVINGSTARQIIYALVVLLGYLSWPVYISAQDKTLDFLGEINDAEHKPGYRDYVEMGCWQCHGFQGQGAGSAALAPNPLPYEAFANQVRRPVNVMPAYSPNVLSDERLRRIYGYMQSIPPAPDISDIPLLSVE